MTPDEVFGPRPEDEHGHRPQLIEYTRFPWGERISVWYCEDCNKRWVEHDEP